jgi:hypothetical protein
MRKFLREKIMETSDNEAIKESCAAYLREISNPTVEMTK